MTTIFFGEGDDTWRPSEDDDQRNYEDEWHGAGGNDRFLADLYVTNPARDLLFGDAGNDTLNGGHGDDVLWGGTENDELFGDSPGLTDSGNDSLNGGSGDDKLDGDQGDDLLTGEAGADTISGGEGFDTADYSASLAAVDARIGGVGQGGDAQGDVIRSDVENLNGSAFGDLLVGTGGDNFFQGVNGDDSIFGGGGEDLFYGGEGNDYLDGGAGADEFYGSGGNADTVSYYWSFAAVFLRIGIGTGAGGDANGDFVSLSTENIIGSNIGGDVLFGSDFDNRLEGWGGEDLLFGEGGHDQLLGDAGNDFLTGGAGGDRLDGGQGTDRADYSEAPSGLYADLLAPTLNSGEAAGDSYVNMEDLEGSGFDDTLVGSDGANAILGNGGRDALTGRVGSDTLNGGADLDTLSGGGGNDLYVLGETAASGGAGILRYDTVEEFAGDSSDSVLVNSDAGSSSLSPSYTLTADVENGTITGGSAFRLNGNEIDNILAGNDAANGLNGLGGNDALDGGFGGDTLAGGAGNDRYVLADLFRPDPNSVARYDSVSEAAGGGTDTVDVTSGIGKFSYALEAEVENGVVTGDSSFTLSGNGSNNNLTGNGAANTLRGLEGNDRLDGGLGDDALQGGAGDDTYVLDDVVLPNQISAGRYDTIAEEAGAGNDTVRISQAGNLFGYTLAAQVENGIVTGAQTFNLTGNDLDNDLAGNGAANSLDGRSGNDAIGAGAGDDILTGGGGSDRLAGREGRDTMSGGGGDDVFDYNAVTETGANAATRDVISGFVRGDDKIDLAGIDARAGAGGNQAFVFIGTAGFSAEGQVRAVQNGDDTVIQLNVAGTSGSEAGILLANVTAADLGSGDFVL